ncbi:ATP-binding protein [Nocardioides terrigena]|uniref:ATP-binding protein n=1 Tax=Nocardioides terrigena TaxID=424797 RepID=UPI000D314BCC|nr:ATP-binding protein [Nocardioides terrigena]
MYRSILGAHASILMSLCLFSALPWVGKSWVTSEIAMLRSVIAIVLLCVALDVFRDGERVRHLVLLVGTFLVATPTLGTHGVPNDGTTGMVLSALGLMAARLMWLPLALGVVATCAGVHIVVLRALDLAGAGLTLDTIVLALSTASAAVSFVNAMQHSSITTEQVALANRQRELELAKEETERDARGISQRVLHDDVLGTLHLIADASAPPPRIRRQCSATVAAMKAVLEREEGEAGPVGAPGDDSLGLASSYAQLVHDIRSGSPIRVHVAVGARMARLPELSPDRLAALRRAALEGVRNALRHGRADAVTLALWGDRRDVHLEVRDRGRGVDATAAEGFGLSQSVRRPLQALGGSAALRPREGGGATLAMTIPRHDGSRVRQLQRAHELTTASLGPISTLSRSVAFPLAAAWTVVAVHSAAVNGTWSQLWLAVGWLASTYLIVRRVESRAPDTAWLVTMGCALAGLQVVGLITMADEAMLDFRSWSVGMSALPLVVLVFNLPIRAGALVIVMHLLIVVGAPLIRPELTGGLVPWGSINAVVTCPVPSLVLGWLIRRQGKSLRTEQAREFELEHALAVRQWRDATAHMYFAHVRAETLPWLQRIANGELSLHAAPTRDRARLLAVSARDDLYAPGFFDEALRLQVARFREAGGVIELRAGLTPGASTRTVGQVLARVLPHSGGHRVIVTPPSMDDPRVRISIVPAPDRPAIDLLHGQQEAVIETDVDEFRAVLLIEDLPVLG